MNDHRTVVADAEQSLAALAAELTAAAYAVALRHAVGDRWLDLQLELRRVLTETVKKWAADRPEPPVPWLLFFLTGRFLAIHRTLCDVATCNLKQRSPSLAPLARRHPAPDALAACRDRGELPSQFRHRYCFSLFGKEERRVEEFSDVSGSQGKRDGKEVTQTRQINVHAGDVINLTLGSPPGFAMTR